MIHRIQHALRFSKSRAHTPFSRWCHSPEVARSGGTANRWKNRTTPTGFLLPCRSNRPSWLPRSPCCVEASRRHRTSSGGARRKGWLMAVLEGDKVPAVMGRRGCGRKAAIVAIFSSIYLSFYLPLSFMCECNTPLYISVYCNTVYDYLVPCFDANHESAMRYPEFVRVCKTAWYEFWTRHEKQKSV